MTHEMLEKLKQIVIDELSCSAHDLSHVSRVFNNACMLAEGEDVDIDVLKTAALMHDIAKVKEDTDSTGQTDHAVLGAAMTYDVLVSLGCDVFFAEHVRDAIESHRFKGGNAPASIEAKILFDADKLDILGAIGIARSYMIAGEYHQPVYSDADISEYIASNLVGGSPKGRIIDIALHAPNLEFTIKVRKIQERLFTKKAQLIAAERISFMERFFETLKDEVRTDISFDYAHQQASSQTKASK